jgi:hypothetical protein
MFVSKLEWTTELVLGWGMEMEVRRSFGKSMKMFRK